MRWVQVQLLVNSYRGRIGDVIELPAATAVNYVEDGRARYAGRREAAAIRPPEAAIVPRVAGRIPAREVTYGAG